MSDKTGRIWQSAATDRSMIKETPLRKALLTLALSAAFTGALAAPAVAAPPGPEIPTLPQNCHEWNQLLGIQNVRSCDDPDY